MKVGKRYKDCLLFTIFFVLLIVISFYSLWSRGLAAIWTTDGVGQYYPSFLYIGKYVREFLVGLMHGKWVLPIYDLSIGMGEDIIGCLNYYGFGDPINLLAVIANDDNGAVVFTASFILRLYLAGLAALYYCREMKMDEGASVIGVLSYVFSGFAICGGLRYVEWLTVLLYFPLVLAGAEKIIKDENKKYVLSLGILYGSLSGFYYLYMVSIALAVYCVVRLVFIYGIKKIRVILRIVLLLFAYYSVGIILASPILFPAIKSFFGSERNGRVMEIIRWKGNYIPNLSLLKNFFQGSIIPDDSYSMGISLVEWIFIFVFFFFPNNKKRIQLKIGLVVIILLITLPIVYWGFNAFGESNDRWYFMVHFFLMVVYITSITDVCSIFLKNGYKSRLIKPVVLLVTCLVISGNMWYLFEIVHGGWKEDFITYDSAYQYTTSPYSESKVVLNDRDLFRVSNDSLTGINGRPENVAMINDYYGLTYWFSVINGNTQRYVDHCNGESMRWRSFGFNNNLYTEAMAGCKYYFSKTDNVNDGYELIDSVIFNDERWFVYKNQYFMGMAYVLPANSPEYDTEEMTLEEYNQHLYQRVIDNSIENIKYEDHSGTFQCSTDGNSGILIVAIPYSNSWKAYVDGVETALFKHNMYLALNVMEGNHDIVLKYENNVLKSSVILLLIMLVIITFFYIMRKGVKI